MVVGVPASQTFVVVEKLLFTMNASCLSLSDFDLGVEVNHNSFANWDSFYVITRLLVLG